MLGPFYTSSFSCALLSSSWPPPPISSDMASTGPRLSVASESSSQSGGGAPPLLGSAPPAADAGSAPKLKEMATRGPTEPLPLHPLGSTPWRTHGGKSSTCRTVVMGERQPFFLLLAAAANVQTCGHGFETMRLCSRHLPCARLVAQRVSKRRAWPSRVIGKESTPPSAKDTTTASSSTAAAAAAAVRDGEVEDAANGSVLVKVAAVRAACALAMQRARAEECVAQSLW